MLGRTWAWAEQSTEPGFRPSLLPPLAQLTVLLRLATAASAY